MPLKKIPYNTLSKNIKGYIEYLPPSFDGQKKFPILYWLHGLGETGDGSSSALDKILNRQICNWLKTNNVDFIVLAPQDGSGYWNGATNSIQKFVEWANIYYKNVIDFSQQHIAGLSSGGYGIRDFIVGGSETYKAFATLIPMSTNLDGATSKAGEIVKNKQKVWIHQGTADTVPNELSAVLNFHNAIRKIDPNSSRLTAYEGLGHSAWDKVYNSSGRNAKQRIGTAYYNWAIDGPTIFEWMKANGKDVIVTPEPEPEPEPVPEAIVKQYVLNDEYFIETAKGKYKVSTTKV